MKTTDKVHALERGEMTLAQLLGITGEQAREFGQMGCDLAAAGRLDEARIVFEGLIAANPRDAGAHAALGTVYQQLKKTSSALTAYSAALELDRQNPVALANRGELRLHAGDKGGVDDLRAAVRADPEGKTSAVRRAREFLAAHKLNKV